MRKSPVNIRLPFAIIIRVLVSGALLVAVFRMTGVRATLEILRTSAVSLIVVGYCTDFALTLVQAWRWQCILRSMTVRISFLKLWLAIQTGNFFGLFMPTSFGGDLFRFVEIRSASFRKSDIAVSIVADRYISLLALMFLGLSIAAIGINTVADEHKMFLAVVASLYILLLIPVLGKFPRKAPPADVESNKLSSVMKRLILATARLRSVLSCWRILTRTFLLSCIIQITGLGIVYMFACSVGITIPFPTFTLILILIMLMTLIPVSLSGIGIREVGFVLLMTRAGISESAALSLSTLTFSRFLVLGIVGGIVYLVSNLFRTHTKQL